jgi:hypothetical protein
MGLGLGATVCGVTSVMAGATVWLLLTEPVKMAGALSTGDVGTLANAMLGLLTSAVRTLLGYL